MSSNIACNLYTPPYRKWPLERRSILVRIDGNVPCKNGTIVDATRLEHAQQTLCTCSHEGARVAALTHRGRPSGYEADLSTALIQKWFDTSTPCTIHVHENVRFHAGEYTNDTSFASSYTQPFDYYINDAWGAMHRRHASIVAMAYQFSPHHRSYGDTVARELEILTPIRSAPTPPFYMILGGGKPVTKLPLIQQALSHHPQLQCIVLPGLATALLDAQAHHVLSSREHADLMPVIRALQNNPRIIVPHDYLVGNDTWSPPYRVCRANELEPEHIPLSVGPQTLNLIQKHIHRAQTIFYNGLMGMQKHPKTLQPFFEIVKHIGQTPAMSVSGGGDTTYALKTHHICDAFTFCSTGGGATCAYLAGGTLPGLAPLFL